MSRFNTAAVKKVNKRPDTHNRAGGQAFEQSDKMKFVSILLTSMVKTQFYRGADETVKELTDLLDKIDPKFAAKAAIFARNEFGMRSITHIVGAEVPARVKGERWTKDFIDKVIYRPDDATEILSYYLANYGKPVPNSLKKGLAKGLQKFDGYQLAKYRGDKKGVSLVDILNLTHAKPGTKNANVFAKLIEGELKSADTWEARLSKAGTAENKTEAKADAWSDLVKSRKIGYFALLRNLRNIETQAPELLDDALEMLVDEKLIKKSLVLPFRFATAASEISNTKTLQTLNKALDISVSNCPTLEGKTLIAIDHSGSMGGGLGLGSKQPKDIADLFAAVILKSNPDANVMVFGTTAGYVSGLNPDDSTLTIKAQIGSVEHGWGTNFNEVYKKATGQYARVITLSDMQSWVGYRTPQGVYDEYVRRTGARPHNYNFDLAGYGSTLFPKEKVYELVGFSEKIFDIMKVLEQDKDALINKIEAVQL